MTPPRQPPESNQDMILGEMRGQLREVVHSVNNLSSKFDGLSREVIGLGAFVTDIAALKADVAGLKRDRDQRDGAQGLLGLILKSPALGWLVGAAISAWAILTGKVHL